MLSKESTGRKESTVTAGKLGLAVCFVVAAVLGGSCTVSDTGLAPAGDAGSACGEKTPMCPKGLTSEASWPSGTCYAACIKPCGPDDIGTRYCAQTNLATCQATGDCLCLQDYPAENTRCVACLDCAIQAPSDCYRPTNAAKPPACAAGVTQGGPCGPPACDRQLCMEADGKTGCVCNEQGKYACATWGGTSWQ
jgi:hypothetical protein